ncbi:MAG: Aconitate hydratase A [Myxococcota bacterium]|nr:Aconitate hydratase A [Myxococcota bacterium]
MSIELIQKRYEKFASTLAVGRKRLGRPLTLTEKILFSHLDDPEGQELVRGKSYLALHPDRVAMQDATAQMALLQFMLAGRDETAAPSTVHCDHLIQAHQGAAADMKTALDVNREVYDFLATVSARYGIGFWKPGAGIIHQVVLENYAFPGGMMIGTDSHTPNAGGLGMWASGVGGADAVDVMVGLPWEVLNPLIIGVKLTGKLSGWVSPKEVILKLCDILTTKGGTNAIIEYFGPGVESISCTGKATIANMGAELGATTSIFPYDSRMETYLKATERADVAALANQHAANLRADPEVLADPAKYFDRVIEIDLDKLEPAFVGPHTPDKYTPLSKMGELAGKEGIPTDIRYALIGSCTNSSYEDIGRSTHLAKQAAAKGLKTKIPLLVTPGSEQIHQTIQRDGQMGVLESVGAQVLANACGPCIGQWKRDDIKKGEKNTIITSYNRNFPARNDGNTDTMAFIGSPEVVTAVAFSGKLDFNPLTDAIDLPDGSKFRFAAPEAPELPSGGFAKGEFGFVPPPSIGERHKVNVAVKPGSDRLELLSPFDAWNGKDYEDLLVLAKARGKCTTDHISPAGSWLKYRGHLTNISGNLFLTVVNAFHTEAGKGVDQLSGESGVALPELAKRYKNAGRSWVMFGDENYGEGSSREHAAMEPRYMGCKAVIARSFARIHETNLKKQGLLPLHFVNPADYDKVRVDDRVTLSGLVSIKPGKEITMILNHKDGTRDEVMLRHTFSDDQLVWFRAGSALNALRAKSK